MGVSALSYTGLVGTQLTLGDLALALGAGTTDELLNTQVTVAQFYAAVVESVSNDDDPGNDGVANVLNASILQAINANAALGQLTVGQILALGPGDDAALASTVNVLDLVTAAAYVANGDNALAIPGATLPAGVTASLYVIEAPRLACGRGVAETSQLRLVLKQTLPVVGLLGLNVASVNLEVSLNLAKAKGGVGGVGCTNGVASALQARIDQATLVDLDTKLDVKLLGLPVTSATIPANVPATGSGGTYTIPLPQYYDEVFHVPGSGTVGIPQVSTAQLSALGINLGAVGGLVVAVVNPALQALSGVITNVLTPLLGLRVAGVDLFPVREATCRTPPWWAETGSEQPRSRPQGALRDRFSTASARSRSQCPLAREAWSQGGQQMTTTAARQALGAYGETVAERHLSGAGHGPARPQLAVRGGGDRPGAARGRRPGGLRGEDPQQRSDLRHPARGGRPTRSSDGCAGSPGVAGGARRPRRTTSGSTWSRCSGRPAGPAEVEHVRGIG